MKYILSLALLSLVYAAETTNQGDRELGYYKDDCCELVCENPKPVYPPRPIRPSPVPRPSPRPSPPPFSGKSGMGKSGMGKSGMGMRELGGSGSYCYLDCSKCYVPSPVPPRSTPTPEPCVCYEECEVSILFVQIISFIFLP